MRSVLVRLTPLLVAAAMLAGGWSFAAGNAGQALASANDPSPTPTFFSELGPASMVPPRDSRMPIAGHGAPAPWPRLAGLALAIGGAALVYTALRMRPQNDA